MALQLSDTVLLLVVIGLVLLWLLAVIKCFWKKLSCQKLSQGIFSITLKEKGETRNAYRESKNLELLP